MLCTIFVTPGRLLNKYGDPKAYLMTVIDPLHVAGYLLHVEGYPLHGEGELKVCLVSLLLSWAQG
jgi:hypothetical protein